jgi:hypothetical protein
MVCIASVPSPTSEFQGAVEIALRIDVELCRRQPNLVHARASDDVQTIVTVASRQHNGYVVHELRRAANGIGSTMSVSGGDTRDTARRVAHRRDRRLGRRGGDGRGVHARVVRANAGGQLQDGHPGSVIPLKVGGG